jgi:DNA-binding NtrC family response regulator
MASDCWETTLPLAALERANIGELRLIIVGEKIARTHVLPDSGTVTIGRAEDAVIRLTDASISRRHAVLHVGEKLTLEDLGGTNGTCLRGARVESGKTVEIISGDVIEVGTTLLIVQGRSQAQSGITRMRGELPMEALRRLIARIAQSDLSVLLLGETGSGKGFIANELHTRSKRSKGPFLQLNCAALPAQLLESELFGYEKGAFTGATQSKQGLLEAASGGTVLLDEIGELPMDMQPKLLRAVEHAEVTRLGAVKPRPVDVRFISATNRNLEAELSRGKFREDLFFRLNGISIEVPPLRRRVSEIPELATTFAEEACRRAGVPTKSIAPEAMEVLKQHRWPGNIRELRNVIGSAVALSAAAVIEPDHLSLGRIGPARNQAPELTNGATEEHPERARILRVLDRCGWNQSMAAAELGISRQTLSTRLDEYKIPRPRKRRKA